MALLPDVDKRNALCEVYVGAARANAAAEWFARTTSARGGAGGESASGSGAGGSPVVQLAGESPVAPAATSTEGGRGGKKGGVKLGRNAGKKKPDGDAEATIAAATSLPIAASSSATQSSVVGRGSTAASSAVDAESTLRPSFSALKLSDGTAIIPPASIKAHAPPAGLTLPVTFDKLRDKLPKFEKVGCGN